MEKKEAIKELKPLTDTELIQKASKTNSLPDAELQRVRQLVPEALSKTGIRLLKRMSDDITASIYCNDVFSREAVKHEIAQMHLDYGYLDATSQIEKHMIEHVIACYMRLWIAERDYTAAHSKEHTLTLGIYWEKRMLMLQTRYLRAVEILAQVRRLKLPNVQINIADKQQVNNNPPVSDQP